MSALPVTQTCYATRDRFDKDPDLGVQRYTSKAIDYGSWWRDHPAETSIWAVEWIEKTGELIAHYRAGVDELDHVDILRVFDSLSHVEECLQGWQKFHGRDGSLAWLKA